MIRYLFSAVTFALWSEVDRSPDKPLDPSPLSQAIITKLYGTEDTGIVRSHSSIPDNSYLIILIRMYCYSLALMYFCICYTLRHGLVRMQLNLRNI